MVVFESCESFPVAAPREQLELVIYVVTLFLVGRFRWLINFSALLFLTVLGNAFVVGPGAFFGLR